MVSIELPPLRERKEDIPVLVNHFLNEFTQRGYRRVKGVSSQVMEAFFRYDWPGNVRELENAIEHALVCSRDEVINLTDLPLHIQQSTKVNQTSEFLNTGSSFTGSFGNPTKRSLQNSA